MHFKWCVHRKVLNCSRQQKARKLFLCAAVMATWEMLKLRFWVFALWDIHVLLSPYTLLLHIYYLWVEPSRHTIKLNYYYHYCWGQRTLSGGTCNLMHVYTTHTTCFLFLFLLFHEVTNTPPTTNQYCSYTMWLRRDASYLSGVRDNLTQCTYSI